MPSEVVETVYQVSGWSVLFPPGLFIILLGVLFFGAALYGRIKNPAVGARSARRQLAIIGGPVMAIGVLVTATQIASANSKLQALEAGNFSIADGRLAGVESRGNSKRDQFFSVGVTRFLVVGAGGSPLNSSIKAFGRTLFEGQHIRVAYISTGNYTEPVTEILRVQLLQDPAPTKIPAS